MIELKGRYNKDCKVFVDDVEAEAIALIQDVLDHEVSLGVPVRVMPDTHVGKGIVIGFTMPMTSIVNPNFIGVDIGCSVTSHRLDKRFTSADLPELDRMIRRTIPMGHEIHKGRFKQLWWVDEFFATLTDNISQFRMEWEKRSGEKVKRDVLDPMFITKLCHKVGITEQVFYNSVGSLGGGNHFIEIGESLNNGAHFLTLHSGSRNFGLKVCNFHAKKMSRTKSLPKAYHEKFEEITKTTRPKSAIPDRIAALNEEYRAGKKERFLEGEDMYSYLQDMIIAQTYAEYNHKVMSQLILKNLQSVKIEDTIHSKHNFIDPQDWIIRKGAIRAYVGERMIIPFNMRDGILICEGKSNPDWNYSAPHGAGRILGRNQSKKTLDMADFEKAMEGIYSTSVTKSTLDEAPMAYKDKDMIIQAIEDTAVILDSVKPILNIKANLTLACLYSFYFKKN